MIEVDLPRFEYLLSRALDTLPPAFADLIDNVAVVVEEEPSEEDLRLVGLDPEEDDLLGLYHGVPLDERGHGYSSLPDRVVIYRLPVLWICNTEADVVREVRDTLVHELGHHFGLGDDDMPY